MSRTFRSVVGGAAGAVGQSVRIGGQPYRVIGVLASKGGTGFANQDDQVLVPLSTAQTRLLGGGSFRGANVVSTINVQAASSNDVPQVMEAVAEALRERHRTAPGSDDFVVQSQQDTLNTITQVTGTLTIFLGGIAGISLVYSARALSALLPPIGNRRLAKPKPALRAFSRQPSASSRWRKPQFVPAGSIVGGIGIMNIMLVSVTERTREIGVRKAVGARRRDILVQFLVESAVLSVVGGAAGIAAGWMVAALIGRVQVGNASVTPVVGADTVLLATLFSMAVGLFFGIYPASRAAVLQPVEALRYE